VDYAEVQFAGKQTMGEEYCDILQTYKGEGAGPTPVRYYHRLLLFILRVICPYALQRLTMKADTTRNISRRYFREESAEPNALSEQIWDRVSGANAAMCLYFQNCMEHVSVVAHQWLPAVLLKSEHSSSKVIQVGSLIMLITGCKWSFISWYHLLCDTIIGSPTVKLGTFFHVW
jgi:hypothetical protein